MPHTLVDSLRRRRARLLLALLVATAAGTAACTKQAPEAAGPAPLPAGSNILLITVDTLRADHLSSYGYVRPTSPVLDALAAEGVRFDQAQVQWPKTTPSFASIFTASYPKDNQIVRTAGQPVSCKFSMLAEELKRRGYATAAVVALTVVPEQQRGPDLGVEGDVVLAHEVHDLGGRVVPPRRVRQRQLRHRRAPARQPTQGNTMTPSSKVRRPAEA